MDLCWCLAVVFGLALFTPGISRAFFEDLYVSGFVSQGYYKTSEYDFILSNSTKGTSEFNEAAISVQANPIERLRIGIQLIATDAGDMGNNEIRVDWAFGDYRWRDWLGFRAGKIKMQMGFYNIGRDIDMLRTSIFLPQSVYSENWRDFAMAQEGISFYGNSEAGPVGSVEYEAYAGALNVPDPDHSYWQRAFSSSAEFDLAVFNAMFGGDTLSYDLQQIVGINPAFPWIAGGSMIWNTPVEGLRFGASLITGEYEMTSKALAYVNIVDPNTGALKSSTLESLDVRWAARYLLSFFSVEYSWRQFILAAETLRFEQEHEINQGTYIMLTWEPTPVYSLSGYVSEFIPDIDNRDGKNFEDPLRKDFTAWQREAVLSGRVNLTSNWLVKAEFHAVDGIGQIFYTPEVLESNSRYWTMFALKTTFHF